MAQIDYLQESDCNKVAALHLMHLRTSFTGQAGKELLACYYRAVVRQVGACGYVAKENDEIEGFVCGVWQPSALRNILLRSQWLGLGWWAVWQVLSNPRFALDSLSRIRFSLQIPHETRGYELRPIVVAPIARGSGVAQLLLNTLLKDAAQRGYKCIYLHTEEDNALAKSFYKKTGFKEVGKVYRLGVTHLRYERSVIMENYES